MARKVIDRTFFEKIMILVDCLFAIGEVVISALVIFKVWEHAISVLFLLNAVFFLFQALEYKGDRRKTALLYICCAVAMAVLGVVAFFI